MNAEQQIKEAQIKLNYPTNYSNEILLYFKSHKDYELAKKIYWYYQTRFSISPLSDNVPPVRTVQEGELWLRFHNLMHIKFDIK